MTTIAEDVFNFILEDKHLHQKILGELPEDKRAAVTGRKGRLIVTGPQGGTFMVRLTPLVSSRRITIETSAMKFS